MNNIEVKQKDNLVIEPLIQRFLNYIDVSENTTKAYNVGLIQFNEYLKANGIKEPTRETIIEFREYLLETHKPKTVNLYLIAVKNFYSWLEYEGITKDISKKIKGIKLEQRHLKRGLSQEEIKQVLGVCKDIREELLVKLMITCGLRCNEVVNIETQDFYKDGDAIMLKVLGKGRDGLKQDLVRIDNRLFELIKEYCKEYNVTDYLFTSTSNHNTNGKLTTKTIRYIITNLFKKAELDMEMLSTHSTRHTSCELALESGLDLREVSEFMRHRSLQTTLVYAKELEQRNSVVSTTIGNYVF